MKKKTRYQEAVVKTTNGLSRWKWIYDVKRDQRIYEEYNAFKEIMFYI